MRLFEEEAAKIASESAALSVEHLIDLDFREKEALEQIQWLGSTPPVQTPEGSLLVEVRDDSCFLVLPFHRDASEANLFSIRYRRVGAGEKTFPKLYWTTPAQPMGTEENALTTARSPNVSPSLIHFPLCQSLQWQGRIELLRFHPSLTPGRFEIDFIKISKASHPSLSWLITGHPQIDEATMGTETRPATLCPAPEQISCSIVPGPSTVLLFGIGIHPYRWASLQETVTARILLKGTLGRKTLFSHTLDPTHREEDRRWMDGRVDLSDFAGKRIHLIFSIESSAADPMAIWSCPRLVHALPEHRPKRPNLVLVSVDTLRADHVGCYGGDETSTPHMDALADRGTLFENAVSQASWTLPSHMSLFTSLYPVQHGVHTFNDRKGMATPSVIRALRDAGYHTLAITEGGATSHRWGLSDGFDSYFEFHEMPNRMSRVVDRAAEILNQNTEEPIFLFLHSFEAHDYWMWNSLSDKALAVLPAFLGKNPPSRMEPVSSLLEKLQAGAKGISLFTKEEGEWLHAMYRARIASVDQELGRLREILDSRNDTILAITSDHGEEFEEHGARHHGHSHHRELLHVPLILYGPGIEPGARLTQLIRLVDILPMLSDLSQVSIPWMISGSSPFSLEAPSLAAGQTTFPFMKPAKSSLTRFPWHYIYDHDRDKELLYRWDEDPTETVDLSQRHLEELQVFRTHLLRAVCSGQGHHLILFGAPDLEIQVSIQSPTPLTKMQGLFLDPAGYDLSLFPETVLCRSRLSRGWACLTYDGDFSSGDPKIRIETPFGEPPLTRLKGSSGEAQRFWLLQGEIGLPSALDEILAQGSWQEGHAFLLERKGLPGAVFSPAMSSSAHQALRDLGYLQ